MSMNDTDFNVKALELAKKLGWDATNLAPAQHRMLYTRVRSSYEKIHALGSMVISMTATSVKLRVVPDAKAKENATQCRKNECNRYRKMNTPNGGYVEACDACGCQGKALGSKWKDSWYSCPMTNPETNKPYWTNEGATVEEINVDIEEL